MEIKAYRARFVGKESFGIPSKSDALLDVMLVKEEPDAYITGESIAFAVQTHDRGDAEQASMEGSYYQITFRIVYEASEIETAGLQINDLELVLDEDHGNPLIFNPQANLWYQQTFFRANGRPLTYNDIANDKRLRKKYVEKVRYVDSIRTAGVFSVQLRSKRDPLVIYDRKRIYVLPSLIDSSGYKYMLDHLLSIHERLVVNADSAVGIGGRDTRKLIRQFGDPQYDTELWERLKPEIYTIMHMPAILQQKSYHRLPHNKLRRFDNRVMRSYISSGGQWAEGVVYADDHDTQENRIIKCILQRFTSTVLPSRLEDKLGEAEIEKRIVEELSKQFSPDALVWYKQAQQHISAPSTECEHRSITFSRGIFQDGSYQKNRKKRIYFKHNVNNRMFEIRTNPPEKLNSKRNTTVISDFTYYPFSDSERPCGLCLTTKDFSTALEIILVFTRLYETEKSTNLQPNQINIVYSGTYSPKTKNDSYGYGCGPDVTDVNIITIEDVVSCRFTGDDCPPPQVTSLFELYREILNSNALMFMAKVPQMEIVEYIQSRRAYYVRVNSHAEATNRAVSAHNEIQNTLSEPWFTAITPVHSYHFQQTPIFLYNNHYHAVYNTLHEIIQHYPLLVSSFDENLFGVHDTPLVYEYWVFYELLNRFLNLGFVFAGNTEQVVSQLRNLFVEHLLHNSMPEGFAVCMHRDINVLDNTGVSSGETATVEIMVGFNCVFGNQEAPTKKRYDEYLTPDFFIRITREDGYHWYFLDAKYEKYTETMLYKRAEDGKRKNSIGDVCLDKYIKKMQDRRFIDEFADFHHKMFPTFWQSEYLHNHFIEGSYLIIARYQEETDEQITAKDRLCGDHCQGIIDENERPMHRFGSIVFRPGKEDEMTSLLEMIFEYKEGAERIGVGKPQPREETSSGKKDMFNDKDAQITHIHVQQAISELPSVLHACWDSSVDHTSIDEAQRSITILPQLTKTNRYKYHVICSCGARRYENYCIRKTCRREIIKHDIGNFHYRRSSTNRIDRWNYVCPYCGNDIDPMDSDSPEESYDGNQIVFQAQSPYDEPPPLTDEELLASAPPEELDYGASYGDLPF